MALTTFGLFGREELGLGAAAIGSVGTLAGAAGLPGVLFVGRRLPTTKAPAAVGAGVGLLAASLVIVGISTSVWEFVAGAALLGLSGGATAPSLATAVAQASPEGRDRALARYAAVLSMSLALGPPAETGLLELAHQDLRLPFVAFAFLPAAALALGLSWGRPPNTGAATSGLPSPARQAGGQPAGPGAPPKSRASGAEPELARRSGQLRSLLASRGGRMALTVQLLYSVPFSAITVFGALVARSVFKMTPAGAQLAFTVLFVTSLLSRLLVARVSPISDKRRAFVLAAALTATGMALISLGGPPVVMFTSMVLLGVPHGVTFPLALALTAESVGEDQLAASNAALFAATSAVGVTAPVVLGALVAAAGYRAMTALVLVPVAVFTGLLLAQPSPV